MHTIKYDQICSEQLEIVQLMMQLFLLNCWVSKTLNLKTAETQIQDDFFCFIVLSFIN